MSGGVDSSVAAHLLKEQGHEVIGVFMRHGHQSPVACAPGEPASAGGVNGGAGGENTLSSALPILNRLDHKQGCCTAADAADARRVADRLGIPFYALNLEAEFSRIIDYFVDEYTAGRTPNPCVQCNNWIKFGKLFDYADSVGAEFVATGHYARIEPTFSGTPALLRGRDSAKDQSYVLFGIDKKYLSRMLLPVGDFEKPEIRRRAGELGLNVADKKDSQEICFVTQGHYSDFVKSHLAAGERASAGGAGTAATGRSGDFVLTTGEVVGTHEGIEGFTVGQRKGLGIALGEPKFVVRIEPETNRVVLGDRDELARPSLTAAATNWLVPTEDIPRHCEVQIRYNTAPVGANVQLLPGRRILVEFDEPQRGVAPGQAVVCYDGTRTLGGGWIESF
jgi:tRNA-uridine 2-sulfurtransferase